MNEEIKALKERIEKLESVIVYLICPPDHGVFERSDKPTSAEILGKTLITSKKKGVVHLIQKCGNVEQVIQKAHAICNDRINRN